MFVALPDKSGFGVTFRPGIHAESEAELNGAASAALIFVAGTGLHLRLYEETLSSKQ